MARDERRAHEHDVRAALAKIQTVASLLENQPSPEDIKNYYVPILEASVKQLEALLFPPQTNEK
jgi:hypothetical protein